MKCPNCKGKTRVLITIPERKGVLRRRRCEECKYVFCTKESASDEAHEEFKKAERKRVRKYERAKKKRKGNAMTKKGGGSDA